MWTEIKSILDVESHNKDDLVSTQQHVYIKAFLQIYIFYLSVIVSRKNPAIARVDEKILTGYDIIIEKILFQRLSVTEDDIRNIVYVSDLIEREDSDKKLRITIREEVIFSIIQQSFSLPFPVKSFFIATQLYEDYIQLTLNQVVTDSGLDHEDQESIILQDEIVPILNIYDSLCFYMWSNIIEDKSLIQLCDVHNEYNSDELLEIFSLENQIEFKHNLKRYISENVSIK
jgi:hypothetical protein